MCVLLLPGDVEDSEAIDTLGQLDGPDSPLPTLKGKIEKQLLFTPRLLMAISPAYLFLSMK